MKVAHILPTSCLDMIKHDNIHMMLPHLLTDDDEYSEFYLKGTRGTAHKILDNGMAEAVNFDWDALVGLGTIYGAQEIVAPDVLGDADKTMDAVAAFQPIAVRNPQFDYIGVLQGKSIHDVARMLAFYCTTKYVTKLALPRLLCNTVDKDIRQNFVLAFHGEILKYFGPNSIHCLGGSANMTEVKELRHSPLIRSIDSSVCGVMGLEKRKIDHDPYVGRQLDYFDVKPNTVQKQTIQHNILTLNNWAA